MERSWQRVIPFFDFPEEIRKIIYTTNAVESLHMRLRKVTKNRGSFPTQEAAIKLLYLALQNVPRKWHGAGLARGAAAICDPLARAY